MPLLLGMAQRRLDTLLAERGLAPRVRRRHLDPGRPGAGRPGGERPMKPGQMFAEEIRIESRGAPTSRAAA